MQESIDRAEDTAAAEAAMVAGVALGRIGRPEEGTATLVVRTNRVDAVTALDVELAHRVDAAIEEAGAGLDAS